MSQTRYPGILNWVRVGPKISEVGYELKVGSRAHQVSRPLGTEYKHSHKCVSGWCFCHRSALIGDEIFRDTQNQIRIASINFFQLKTQSCLTFKCSCTICRDYTISDKEN